MPEIFKTRIFKLLKHNDYTPLKLAQLARAIGVDQENYPKFEQAFNELRQAGQVVIGAGNLVTLPPISGRIIGTFRANPKGFGFVIPLEPNLNGDLFIPHDATADAMTGDIVAAKVVKKDKIGAPGRGARSTQKGIFAPRCSGEIVEILERAKNRFVGTLLRQPAGWSVQPDGKGFVEPIIVDDVTAKNAEHKDKVVVEILSFPTEKNPARGVIIEVFGKAGQYESETNAIVHQYHLPAEFNSDCFEQARQAAAEFNPQNIVARDDITEKVVITIDPPDAKDFDDAISLEKNSDGNWLLGVHIADVSTFVTADSPLDSEAKIRGNSVYLPAKTIPMLPEVLSNGICSLQPDQKRFCKSVYLTYDTQGKVLSRSFANSVICSTQRLTYQQAERTLKGHTKDIKPEVVKLLKNMEILSRSIENRRTKNGMLHLDLPETELIMDKSGRVTDARPADNSYPHTMIEMFMVEANEAIASLLDKLNVPFMRRIHPEPDVLTMKGLSQLARALGYALPRTPDRAAIQDLLAAVKDTDISLAMNLIVLRSFEKARYSPLSIGHFALASGHYCHFTSPIRRYADLLVHRVLQCHLQNRSGSSAKLAQNNQILSDQDLTEIGKHISFTEQRSDDAERELQTVLMLQMLSDHIGDELDCVVTGLANFGVFAQSRKFGIEGLIQTGDLGSDAWKYDAKTQSITGLRTGCSIRLGQAIKTRIVSVNVPARQLSLTPVEPLVKAAAQKKSHKAEKPRKERTRRRSKRKR